MTAAPVIRTARRDDLPAIVRLLADDRLGRSRERFAEPLPEAYVAAYEKIDADPDNALIVAEADGAIVGVLQLTFIPHLTYQGGTRAQIEGVRVDGGCRGRGIGRSLLERAIARSRERGCHLVQLTADKQRPDAHRFYESLGFRASHEGMKLHLT